MIGETLEEFVAARRGEPLDPKHPLWTIDLLQGYRGGSAVVCRTHHAIADGIRLTQVLFGLLDPVGQDEAALPVKVGGTAPRRDPVAQPVARVGAALLRALGDAGAKSSGPRRAGQSAARNGGRRPGARRDDRGGACRGGGGIRVLGLVRRAPAGGGRGSHVGDDGVAQRRRDR